MRDNSRKQLEAKRKAEIRTASEKLLSQPRQDVSEHIERIETYDRLISNLPQQRRPRLIMAASVAILVVTLLALAWTVRIPATKVLLVTQGTAMELELDSALHWADGLSIDASPLRLEWLTDVILPPVAPKSPGPSGPDPWVQFEGGRITLSRFELEKGGRLALEVRDNGHVDLYSHRAPLEGELMMWGKMRISKGTGNARSDTDLSATLDLVVPEALTFKAVRPETAAIRAHIGFHPLEEFVLSDLIVRRISFSREIPLSAGQRGFVSSLTGGTLELPEVAERLELRKGERLSLQDARGRIRELKVSEEIYLEFEGTAAAITLGPEGFARDLAPTLLEYIYHNERLLLSWSVLVFLWGLLWNIRVFLVG